MMTILGILALGIGIFIVIIGILTYMKPKPINKKDMDWKCGTMDWLSCNQHPFNEGKCTYCGKS
jgi:hypothetical protein